MKRVSLSVAAAVIATALVAVLAWQNRALRGERDALAARDRAPYPGMFVPEVGAPTVDGGLVNVGSPDDQLQVLYFFTTTCPYCKASAASINALAERLARQTGGEVPMIGVSNDSADELRAYVSDHGFRFPIAMINAQRTLALFRATTVPLVMVVDRNGRVHRAERGAFATEAQIEGVLAAVRAVHPSVTATHDRS